MTDLSATRRMARTAVKALMNEVKMRRYFEAMVAVALLVSCKKPLVTNLKAEPPQVTGSSCSGTTSISLSMSDQLPQQFSYSYLFIPSKDGSSLQPTVVALPGGPGSSNIARVNDIRKFIPEEFNLILIDARGTGCNAAISFPAAAYSSRLHAQDVSSVIASERAKERVGKVILYGASYGTVTATIVSRLLPPDSIIAVVLEGTLGRAYQFGERYEEYARRWGVMISDHPEIAKRFAGPNGEQLATTIFTYMRGAPSRIFNSFIDQIAAPAQNPVEPAQTSADNTIPAGVTPSNEMGLTEAKPANFVDTVNCRELHGHKDTADIDDQGKLVIKTATDDLCSSIGHLDNPYDSRAFLIPRPIYYLQGAEDPATPLKQMQYHRAGQKRPNFATNALILTDHAHDINGDSSIWPCLQEIWRDIAALRPLEFEGNTSGLVSRFCANVMPPPAL